MNAGSTSSGSNITFTGSSATHSTDHFNTGNLVVPWSSYMIAGFPPARVCLRYLLKALRRGKL